MFSKIDFGNGFDFWNTIPTLRRSCTTSTPDVVDRLAVDQHRALDARRRNDVVHPVQRAQERALAAARRADERGHEIGADLDEMPSSARFSP